MKPTLLLIVGPTASGKKKLALAAAERFNGEIVSADSRKVYRHLDIGTAKPSPEDRVRIPHHLIDIVDPDEPFSAGAWVERAAAAIKDILGRGRLPVISGGTGFYIEVFREGLSEGILPDPGVRKRLEAECARLGTAAMHEKLAAVDPGRAAELHVNDTFRILRALEVFQTTGKTITELKRGGRITGGDYGYSAIGVTVPRKTLYSRIDERVDIMVARGLLDELKGILGMGYSRDVPALDTVGYKEWFPLLDGQKTVDECLEDVKRNTRRYAKRQMTWFRAREYIRWVDVTDYGDFGGILDDIEPSLVKK